MVIGVVCLFLNIYLSSSQPLPPVPPYKELFYEQILDHFNFETLVNGEPATYKQRYLLADEFWGTNSTYSSPTCQGPIFFYTGNESPVTDYYAASGFFTQVLAPKYGALLVFAEHRYFGKSIPFPDDPWSPGHIGYLSVDQAIEDYVSLIFFLKSTLPKASGCPVFAFGGSYGGMITTWLRIKYPHIIIGGLAASAPFGFLGSGISPFAFSEAATVTYSTAAQGCGPAIQAGFQKLGNLANTKAGRDQITSVFNLCNLLNTTDDANAVLEWVLSGLMGQAMLDYPYPTDYGIALPGWPVNKTCNIILAESDPFVGLAKGIGVFYNTSGKNLCYDINIDVPDWGSCCAWSYLACTEVYIPSGNRGIFPYSAWNVTDDMDSCKSQFGIQLDPHFPYLHWGSFDSIKQSSKIIFSNGLLDPWHTSGILKSLSDTLIAIVIPEAAHHLDLRAPNNADPSYVKDARQQEDAIIGLWLSNYFQNK